MADTIKERIAKIIHNNWGLISEKDLADLIDKEYQAYYTELAKDGPLTRISDEEIKNAFEAPIVHITRGEILGQAIAVIKEALLQEKAAAKAKEDTARAILESIEAIVEYGLSTQQNKYLF